MTNVRDSRRNHLKPASFDKTAAEGSAIPVPTGRLRAEGARIAASVVVCMALCFQSTSVIADDGDFTYGRTPVASSPSGSAGGVVIDTNRRGLGASVRAGHVAGDTVGRNESLSILGISPFVNIGDGLLFGDARLGYANNGGLTWSFGSGYRHYITAWDAVLGGYGYFDRDEITGAHFKQWSVGAEILARRWEARGNYSQPFDNTSSQTGSRIDGSSAEFVGYNVEFDRIDTFAEALEGYDAEIGFLLPGKFSERIDLRAFGGGYSYKGVGQPRFSGFSTRLQADVGGWLEMGLKLTDDEVTHTNVSFQAIVHVGGFESQEHTQRCAIQRMAEPVRRNLNIPAITSDVTVGGQVALAADGMPLTVVHVNSAAPAGGTGTVDDPFNQLSTGLAFPDSDIVFTHAGSTFGGPPENIVNLADGQSLFGEGLIEYPTGVRKVVNSVILEDVGELILPDSPTFAADLATFGLDPTIPSMQRPLLSDTIGDAVTMGNDSSFGGFVIDAPTGTGIVINAVEGTIVSDTHISNAGGTGILVQDTFADSTTTIIDTIIENATGPAFHVNRGSGDVGFSATSENLDPAFGAIMNTSAEAVLIEDRTGGTVNMLRTTIDDVGGTGIVIRGNGGVPTTGNITIDNASITDSSATGILVQNAEGNISFRNTIRAATTIDNAADDSVQIDGLTVGSNVTFEDLSITNPIGGGIDIDNLAGSFVFTKDLIIGAPAAGAVGDPAISVANSLDTGIVLFGRDVTILGSAGRGVELVSNATGSSFGVNGLLSITSAAAESIAIVNNGGTSSFLGGVGINQRGDQGIHIETSTGPVTFQQVTTIPNNAPVQSLATAVDISGSESLVVFENLLINNALDGGGVRLNDNIGGALGPGQIIFNDVEITSLGTGAIGSGTGFQANNNTRIRVDDGMITSTTASAVNIANSGIDITFESINSTASPDFGISLVETNVENQKTFQVLGDISLGGFGTGGAISTATIAGVNLANAGQVTLNSMTLDDNNFGFFIRNSGLVEDDDQFLSLNFTQVSQSTIRGIDSENLKFLDIRDSVFDDNGDTAAGLGGDGLPVTFAGRETIVLNYNERLNDEDTTLVSQFDEPYLVNIQRTTLVDNSDDVIIITNEAVANGLQIGVNITDNAFTLNDTSDFDILDLDESAFEMVWNGVAQVNIFNNDVSLNGTNGAESQAAFIIQNRSFEDQLILDVAANTIPLSVQDNSLGLQVETDALATIVINNNDFNFNGTEAIGMDFDLGPNNNVSLLNNLLLFQNDGGTGMLFRMVSQPALFTISGNDIGLTDLAVGTNEIGILFRTVVGTPTLQGQLNNRIVLLNPGFIGGVLGAPSNIEIDFAIPRANGQILINGALRP